MSERDAFDRILASMHRATLDDVHWSTASRLIEDELRASSTSLVFGAGNSDRGVQIFMARSFSRGEPRPEVDREYFDVYYPRDERVPRLRRLPDGQPAPIATLYTDRELKTSAAYNEFLVPHQAGNSLIVRLAGPAGTRIVWVVNDPTDHGGWSSAQIELVQRLVPHIRQYVSVRQLLAGAGALDTSLAGMLESTGPGIIQVDWRGKIVAASDGARMFLRNGDALFDSGGFLFARFPRDNAILQGLLTRALPPFGRQGTGGSMVLGRPSDRNSVELHVHPVGQQEASLCAWPVAALVLVVDPGKDRIVINPDLLAARFGLTGAETRVAVMLAEGKSVHDIAESTVREISTIRTHVQRVFRKTRTNRQADLVRLVLSISGDSGLRL
ncbi:MAG: helix-turn-helix transcriptional regulator [Gemmatimonadota bacterium]|nr:helix-turn-helix transcriptional regulator [Gemmatimonadota bacterium]